MKISELARASGAAPDTIRYYERAGLLPAPLRTAAGWRDYGAAHAGRLAFIRQARSLGMSLDEVRALLRCHDGACANCRAAHALIDAMFGAVAMGDIGSPMFMFAKSLQIAPPQIAQEVAKIINESWSARKVEQYMVEVKARAKAAQKAEERPVSAESESRAAALSKKLGVGVKVRTNARGSGDIVLKFKDEKEFEKLCSILTA